MAFNGVRPLFLGTVLLANCDNRNMRIDVVAIDSHIPMLGPIEGCPRGTYSLRYANMLVGGLVKNANERICVWSLVLPKESNPGILRSLRAI